MLWKKNRNRTSIVDDLAIQYLRSLDSKEIENAQEVLAKETSLAALKEEGKMLIGISVKPVTNEKTNQEIVSRLAKAIIELNAKYADKLHFVFFPFAKTESVIESDSDLVRQVIRRARKQENITILDHLDPLCWFVGIRDYIDAFIGMRLHSIIFASEAKKPILCIPYERKVWEFIKNDNEIAVLPLDGIKSSAFVNFVENQLERIIPGKPV